MADQFLDITGDACPLTLLKVKLALEAMPPGSTLEVRLAGGEPLANLPATLREEGFAVTAPRADGEHYRVVVGK